LNYKGDYFMKKARLVLTAVAAFTVLGGVFAFKANKVARNPAGTVYYKTTTATTNFPTLTLFTVTTATNGATIVHPATHYYYTTSIITGVTAPTFAIYTTTPFSGPSIPKGYHPLQFLQCQTT
jgi:hypothetical protein